MTKKKTFDYFFIVSHFHSSLSLSLSLLAQSVDHLAIIFIASLALRNQIRMKLSGELFGHWCPSSRDLITHLP